MAAACLLQLHGADKSGRFALTKVQQAAAHGGNLQRLNQSARRARSLGT